MKPAKLETISGKRVQWMTETNSNVVFARLPQASQSVNHALLLAHYRTAAMQLSCILDDFQYTPKVALYSSRMLSINGQITYYCGGAHPDAAQDNFTLDLRTAKELSLEDVYRFTPVAFNADPSTEGFAQYVEARAEVLAGLIVAKDGNLIKGLDGECKEVYATDNNLAFLTWYLSAKGLVVQSSLPHVAAACENSYELPYSSLTKFLAPNSPLR